MISSNEKVILITGGSDGLGLALAKSLSIMNKVVILARTEEALKQAAEQANCDYIKCDIRDSEQVLFAVNQVIAKFGRIDVLINNAGIWCCDELEENSYSKIENVIVTNLIGTMYVTKTVIPYMKNNNSGFIININSQLGIEAKKERVPYVTSKWGMTGFTRSLQLELEQYGIKVTDIMAGKMKTNICIKSGINAEPSGLDLNDVVKVISFIIAFEGDAYIPEIGIKKL